MTIKRELDTTTPSSSPPPSSQIATPPKKPKTAKPSASPKRTKLKAENAGSKKMGAWSGDELRQLYSIMCPKQIGVKWDEVASQLEGRDAKSCNNKWTRMQGKIKEAIEGMGE